MKTNVHNTPIADFTSVNVEERKKLGITSGDTVKVWVKVVEKGKTRLQAFDGMVLSVKHGTEPGATFTVRATIDGVGVERIFPLFSPAIDKIEVLKRARVRRSKLYHIREKVAREIKRAMRKTSFLNLSTLSETEEAARIEREAKEAEEAAAKAAEEEAAKKAEEEAAAKAAEEAKAAETAEAEAPAEPAATEETPAEETAETTEEAAESTQDKKEA